MEEKGASKMTKDCKEGSFDGKKRTCITRPTHGLAGGRKLMMNDDVPEVMRKQSRIRMRMRSSY